MYQTEVVKYSTFNKLAKYWQPNVGLRWLMAVCC